MQFEDLYDGRERANLFTGEKGVVPEDPDELRRWMTSVSHGDEGASFPEMFADAVYSTNTSQAVIIRLKGVVTAAVLGTPRYVI